MTRSYNTESQGSLFDIDKRNHDGISLGTTVRPVIIFNNETTSLAASKTEIDQINDVVEGPSTDLLMRNRNLGEALVKLASISRAEGFKKARGIPMFNQDITERYGDAIEVVTDRTAQKSDKDAVQVPADFNEAFGTDRLVEAGMLSKTEAAAVLAKEYQAFEAWFGSKQGADRRSSMKVWLNYQYRKLTDKRTRKPTKDFPRHPSNR